MKGLDFRGLNRKILSNPGEFFEKLLPGGKIVGKEYVCASIHGGSGNSCSTNIETGVGKDFATTGQSWCDLIALYAKVRGLSIADAYHDLDAQYVNDAREPSTVIRKPQRKIVSPVPAQYHGSSLRHAHFGLPVLISRYVNDRGELLHYTARYETPDGKKVLPWCFDGARWFNGAFTEPRPLFGLDHLYARPHAPVLIVEGEPCAEAARTLCPKMAVVTWSGGADSWHKADWSPVFGRKVWLWPDADTTGRRAMDGLGGHLASHNSKVDVLDPEPDRPEGWDVADAAKEGWNPAHFDEWAASQIYPLGAPTKTQEIPPPPKKDTAKQMIILPNDHMPFHRAAKSIFQKLAQTGRYYIRGNAVVEFLGDTADEGLTFVTPAGLRSRIDDLDMPVVAQVMHGNKLALCPKRCSESSAKALLDTIQAREQLPRIRMMTRAPVIVPGGRNPQILGHGYHELAGGILVTGTIEPLIVPRQEAVASLLKLLADFDFPSPGDKARALAAIVTPALRAGGWFAGPNPVQTVEADQSQAGKGFLQRLIRGVYDETAYMVARRAGGVGSLDESLAAALLSGRPFVALDNLRGQLDSQYLEMVVTEYESVPVRVPFRGEVRVDCTAVTFQMTSNGVEVTRDFANRASIVRIRKRPKGFNFKTLPEGTVVDHVRAQSSYYLGCVFSVVRAWSDAGRQTLNTGFHDFRVWAGILNWIVQELFDLAPLLEGHEMAQRRVSVPALTWLRSVCLLAEQTNQLDREWSASGLAELSDDHGIDMPGLQSPSGEGQAPKHVGKLMARCFQESGDPYSVDIDGFTVHKTEFKERDDKYRRDKTVKRYRIVRPVLPEDHTAEKSLGFSESKTLSEHSARCGEGEF